jgi:type IV secretion system protein VirD4
LTLQLVFEFMADPAVATAVHPEPSDEPFDVGRFLQERGTLYLLGSRKRHGGMGPLFSALTGCIFEEAKRLSQSTLYPSGRLDPPLSIVLDEAALICPVPLAQWTSDAGGRGIFLVIAVQAPSQLRERWGEHDADTIWTNANILIVFGGLKVERDLESISKLCGQRDERIDTFGTDATGRRSRSHTVRRLPVLAPSAIRELATLTVLLVHRNSRPVLATIQPVWERPDVRQAVPTEMTEREEELVG